jgi:gluconate kinase
MLYICYKKNTHYSCSRGEPLTDSDRLPWLQNINQYIRASAASRTQVIVTCSALKETYRDIILHGVAEMACADDGQETLSICFVALLNEKTRIIVCCGPLITNKLPTVQELAFSRRRQVLLVYLYGTYELLRERMSRRQGHFMPVALLQRYACPIFQGVSRDSSRTRPL